MLECIDLGVNYAGITALSHARIKARAGEVTAVLGSNGAGKSTLIRALAGLVPATGKVLVDSKPLAGSAETRASHGIAIVPEGRQLWPGVTVEEHLVLGAYARIPLLSRFRHRPTPPVQADLQRILGVFPALRARCTMDASLMSGGEQQMLAIARALMASPRILLVDEPSIGLAPLVLETLLSTLRTQAREGLTVLITEQNVKSVLPYADQVVVLRHGRVVFEGLPSDTGGDELWDGYFGGAMT